mgnify:CR=1 FL=1
MKNKNRGFTLAELLIVVAIVGVLLAISIPIFNKNLESSRESVDLSNVRSAYSEVMAAVVSEDDEHAVKVVPLKQKIEKWSALVKSCREGSCGALYAIQKLEMYQTILNALLQQKECASS